MQASHACDPGSTPGMRSESFTLLTNCELTSHLLSSATAARLDLTLLLLAHFATAGQCHCRLSGPSSVETENPSLQQSAPPNHALSLSPPSSLPQIAK